MEKAKNGTTSNSSSYEQTCNLRVEENEKRIQCRSNSFTKQEPENAEKFQLRRSSRSHNQVSYHDDVDIDIPNSRKRVKKLGLNSMEASKEKMTKKLDSISTGTEKQDNKKSNVSEKNELGIQKPKQRKGTISEVIVEDENRIKQDGVVEEEIDNKNKLASVEEPKEQLGKDNGIRIVKPRKKPTERLFRKRW